MIRPIPLSLITGFLGSGKTTFLRHAASRMAGRRVVYLVNEFSDLDVDTQVLRPIGPHVVSIPGGSIFCKCLVVNFLHHLTQIPKTLHASNDPVEGVIVEASGIANPKVVADMLRQTGLDKVYHLASVVTVTDPGSFGKLLVTLPNIRAQVEAADIVLVNKIDLFSQDQLAATETAIRGINPAIRLIRTTRTAADVDLFGRAPARGALHGEYAECADPHYARFSVTLRAPVDLPRLQVGLGDLGDDLYRAKGFVPTPDGTVYLDFSTAGLSIEPRADAGVQAGLAMIAPAGRQRAVKRLISDIRAGRLNAAVQADR